METPMTDISAEKAAIDRLRRCQRNWDTSKVIPEEHLQHWIYLAQNSPSKQDFSYYDTYVITDPVILDALLTMSWGCTYLVIPNGKVEGDKIGIKIQRKGQKDHLDLDESKWITGRVRNPQVRASAYFIFTEKKVEHQLHVLPDGTRESIDHDNRRSNTLISAGIAMGVIGSSAARLGYATGYNTCHGKGDEKKLVRNLLGMRDNEYIVGGIGIGYPQPNRHWYESDETNIQFTVPGGYKEVDISQGEFELNGQTLVPDFTKLDFTTLSAKQTETGFDNIPKLISVKRF